MFRLQTTIPKTVKDPKEIKETFKKYGIVPYYGTAESTSHTFLDFLQNITSLSPSYTAVMGDIIDYVFGQNFDIVERAIPGLTAEDQEDIGDDQKRVWLEWMAERNISLMGLLKVMKRIVRYEEDCGNAYIHIKRIQVGEAVKYHFRAPHYKNAAYLRDKEGRTDHIILSKYLTSPDAESLMRKYPPTILPVTEAGMELKWHATGSGVEEAIIHIKSENHNDDGDIYGRPRILSILNWLHVDYQIGNLNSKISATEIVTKTILAFEAPDPLSETEDPADDEPIPFPLDQDEINKIAGQRASAKKETAFQRNMRSLRAITTNIGPGVKTSSIAGVEYPHGKNPPTPIEIELNRDTKHHSWQSDTAKKEICQVLKWSAELTGGIQAKSNIGGNVLADLYTQRNNTTIKPRQRHVENIINTILVQVGTKEGAGEEITKLGISLPNVITELVDRLKGNSTPIAGTVIEPQNPEDGNQND